ncbi:MerC domain-containing protein [Aquisediminimonas sediminicola]|uniref:MerC domain-containing protein n=1 Tax=Alteraquisediminimonas sediminicola TaxID=2676787 RepID=UPI001FEAE48B|nr:MerC domain-containing protein [Aquisediminimonas sediminicola]
MAVSGVCLLHCMLTSVFFGLLATFGGMFMSPLFHEFGLALAIVFAVIAFARGLAEHGVALPSWVGGAGLVAMTCALLVPHGPQETMMTMIGVTILAYGHWLNRRASA